MRRREFITLLGGAAAGLPLAAHAQQPDRLRRIGVLMGTAESDPDQKAMVSVFTRALEDLGWKEGANIRIDTATLGPICGATIRAFTGRIKDAILQRNFT